MIFRYTTGGALVCDKPIKGMTQTLDKESAKYYGGKYFIAESMIKTCALKIATLLGGTLKINNKKEV